MSERPPLAGTDDQPQARMALAAALESGPSHAYLFHGPAGVGKRTAATSSTPSPRAAPW